jgi:hypothetical protein
VGRDEEVVLTTRSDALRRIAEQVADGCAERGYAFIEDDKVDDLALVLDSFLTAAGIPVHPTVTDPARDDDQFVGWKIHPGFGWPLYQRLTVLP